MSNHEQPTPSHPKSDVRNTTGKNKQTPQDSVRTTSAVDLEEFCEKHYEKLLPIMADKYEYEKRKKEKLEEVKARLDFGDARKKSTRAQESAYSESRTISPRRQRRSRSPRHNPSVFTRLRRERSRSPRHEYKSKERRESTVFKRLGSRGRSTSAHSDSRQESSRYTENHSESEDSEGGHWKSKLRRKKSSVEDDDLSQPWVCAETDPFTSRIRHFDFSKTRMPSQQQKRRGGPCQHGLQRSKRSIPEKLPPTEKVHQRPHSASQHQVKRRRVHRRLHTKGKRRPQIKKGKKSLRPRDIRKGIIGRILKKGGGFRSQHKTEKRPDRFTLLTKTPKEILALEKGKFKTLPPMTTSVEKRNANKFCEFHGEVGHNTDECNHLRKQIEDMLKAGKLSHIIRELKQSSRKEQPKKKVRQKITQSFSSDLKISFSSLGNDEGAEGPLIIEAEIGGHQVHRMCIDGGSSFEILYEHCFNRLRSEIRNQMIPAATSLVGFSGEIKWPIGQITLLVKVGDDEHSTSTWMDFMVVRSTSPYNGIIGRSGLQK
ncbi:reverse transcriptase domain-containing protein [Tanacetum coccineum]